MITNNPHHTKTPMFVNIFVKVASIILWVVALAGLLFGIYILFINLTMFQVNPDSLFKLNHIHIGLSIIFSAGLLGVIGRGFWRFRNWSRTVLLSGLIFYTLYNLISIVFAILSTIFVGTGNVTFIAVLRVVATGLLYFLMNSALPIVLIFILLRVDPYFIESARQCDFIEKTVRYVLLGTALSCIIIVFLIFLFTMTEAWDSIQSIGLETMLLGTIWRPGSIIGVEGAQFGLMSMIVGTILSTVGAVIIGVPLSVGTAILLAEVAPRSVREILRPAVELLAGIPSVVYGLFGMVVLAPLIRNIEVPRNTGFGLLNASIVLAVMIIPTMTSITEDAIRAVPREYKEGSLALGGTHWQTITRVILPSARSGILAAIILGVGRALGETMAMIMVIGNSIAMPRPLTNQPLTLFLNTARTLTGNIAVEINYAAGSHRSALFFTGVILFIMILLVNSTARFLMQSRQES